MPRSTALKTCSRCKRNRPTGDFNADPRMGRGLQAYCKPCMRDYARDHKLRTVYGITQADYDAMLKRGGDVCWACGEAETVVHRGTGATQRLAIDHDHATDEIRGLLCKACNLTLRASFDSERLRMLAAYLDDPRPINTKYA